MWPPADRDQFDEAFGTRPAAALTAAQIWPQKRAAPWIVGKRVEGGLRVR